MSPRTLVQILRITLKWLGIIPLLTAYLILSGVVCILPASRKIQLFAATEMVSFFSRPMLRLFGVRVHVKHRERFRRNNDARFVVANHLSYLDIFVISSLIPSVFITSVELRNAPALGTLARAAGCLFVERRKVSGLKKELAMIARVLVQRFPVALFPEGTTSNGDRVQPFKNSLFEAAVITGSDIQPLCIRYTGVNGVPLTHRNRDSVLYYGGISFFQHLSKLLALKSIDVEVIPLKTIRVRPHHSRKDLAVETRHAISAAYQG
jgi:1-acyl-sn-glycerol-3-phosphate acyltransferase